MTIDTTTLKAINSYNKDTSGNLHLAVGLSWKGRVIKQANDLNILEQFLHTIGLLSSSTDGIAHVLKIKANEATDQIAKLQIAAATHKLAHRLGEDEKQQQDIVAVANAIFFPNINISPQNSIIDDLASTVLTELVKQLFEGGEIHKEPVKFLVKYAQAADSSYILTLPKKFEDNTRLRETLKEIPINFTTQTCVELRTATDTDLQNQCLEYLNTNNLEKLPLIFDDERLLERILATPHFDRKGAVLKEITPEQIKNFTKSAELLIQFVTTAIDLKDAKLLKQIFSSSSTQLNQEEKNKLFDHALQTIKDNDSNIQLPQAIDTFPEMMETCFTHLAPLSYMIDTLDPNELPTILKESKVIQGRMNEPDLHGNVLLHTYIERNDTEKIKILLNHGQPYQRPNANGKSPFILAIETKNKEIISPLLEKERTVSTSELSKLFQLAKDNPELEDLITPFLDKVHKQKWGRKTLNKLNDNKITSMVLRHIAERDNITELEAAIKVGAFKAFEALGTLPTIELPKPDQQGNTIFHTIAKENDIEAFHALLARSRDLINTPNKTGETPLYIAAKDFNDEIFQALIADGADLTVNGKPIFDVLIPSESLSPTSLAWLVDHAPIGIFEKILETHDAIRSQVNNADSDGNTPLHKFIYLNEIDKIGPLLKYGAKGSFKTKNKHGSTPLLLAFALNEKDIINLLLNEYAIEDIEQLLPTINDENIRKIVSDHLAQHKKT